MQFTHLAGRKPIANYEADVMPHVGFSGSGGNSGGACRGRCRVTGHHSAIPGRGGLPTTRQQPPHRISAARNSTSFRTKTKYHFGIRRCLLVCRSY